VIEDENDIEETGNQDAEEDNYKPDPAAEQEGDDQNNAYNSHGHDDSEVETTDSFLPNLTDDEDQSLQHHPCDGQCELLYEGHPDSRQVRD
jgi:hypothetical protein